MSNKEKGGLLKSEIQYHIQMKKGDVADFVILPGDPGRVEFIADHFDTAELVADNREYKTMTGKYKGRSVSVTSTGIGCPSTAIAVEELANIGTKTLVRMGTSGAMQEYTKVGDKVIASGAVRFEGTSVQYMPIEFPAVASHDMVMALKEAALKAQLAHHVGIVQSKDSFYGQHSPEDMPIAAELLQKWDAWVKGGVLCSEMEAATLFVVGSYRRLRTGAVLLVAGDQAKGESLTKDEYQKNMSESVKMILEASLKIEEEDNA
jgi:uridine phosphorylase|tara:strand:- start:1161 stop:1949 length:789 start_codon:yes stop_codon:yes gene_type:complete